MLYVTWNFDLLLVFQIQYHLEEKKQNPSNVKFPTLSISHVLQMCWTDQDWIESFQKIKLDPIVWVLDEKEDYVFILWFSINQNLNFFDLL